MRRDAGYGLPIDGASAYRRIASISLRFGRAAFIEFAIDYDAHAPPTGGGSFKSQGNHHVQTHSNNCNNGERPRFGGDARLWSTATREGTGEYVDDTVITTKVKAALLADPLTKVMQVNVETFKGVVQLSGFVESQTIASRAVEIGRGVKGVNEVKNDMRLR